MTTIKSSKGSEAQIVSVGTYRPARLVPNSEIVDRIDSSDEWIQQRTGIESRRFARPDESVIDMAQAAAEVALKRAKLTIADIDTVIVATMTVSISAIVSFARLSAMSLAAWAISITDSSGRAKRRDSIPVRC